MSFTIMFSIFNQMGAQWSSVDGEETNDVSYWLHCHSEQFTFKEYHSTNDKFGRTLFAGFSSPVFIWSQIWEFQVEIST